MQNAASTPRARDLGVPFPGKPGPWNAITDVAALEVGYTTLISGTGPLVIGHGPVRTGVTAIHPRGKADPTPAAAGWFSMNGNGEMTGTTWIDEAGFLTHPVTITNTHSVGIAHHATLRWEQQRRPETLEYWALPVAAETYDGHLNDINGQHVTEAHVLAALDGAAAGPIAEGNVGGGTGMIAYALKGGSGTASRVVEDEAGMFSVGAFVQANFGARHHLSVAGVPVGMELTTRSCWEDDTGSIIVVVATDAPLLPGQCKSLARRCALGVGRTGTVVSHSSGDIFLAFSTARTEVGGGLETLRFVPWERITPFFAAVVEATEEAIVNALVAAETMVGRDEHRVEALPHDELREILTKYGRLA